MFQLSHSLANNIKFLLIVISSIHVRILQLSYYLEFEKQLVRSWLKTEIVSADIQRVLIIAVFNAIANLYYKWELCMNTNLRVHKYFAAQSVELI